LHKIEKYYFDIKETINTSYEIGGLFYDLGLYTEALHIFVKLSNDFGQKADIYYNKILCYYQLRMDKQFATSLLEAKAAFPDFEKFTHLDKLDLAVV
jgi:tetratricopeptide (TPR) repeat protein